MDPLSGTPWSQPSTVEGFVRAAPNAVLLDCAARAQARGRGETGGRSLHLAMAPMQALPVRRSASSRPMNSSMNWPRSGSSGIPPFHWRNTIDGGQARCAAVDR
jgi:hypothetical protein